MVLNLVLINVISNFALSIKFFDGKKEKLIARLLTFPKDFTYDEMRTLYTILLHKPHPIIS